MILSGLEIKKRLGKTIFIEPFDEKMLNPNSCNLHLHDELLVYDDESLDMKKEHGVTMLAIPAGGLKLKPGKLYLGRTLEHTKTLDCVPMIEGRSSVGRLGLFIHVTAGFGDVGFTGFWTLEMFCVQPVTIYAGVEICQIYYHTIEGEFLEYRSEKYQGNTGIQPSLMFKDFQKPDLKPVPDCPV